MNPDNQRNVSSEIQTTLLVSIIIVVGAILLFEIFFVRTGLTKFPKTNKYGYYYPLNSGQTFKPYCSLTLFWDALVSSLWRHPHFMSELIGIEQTLFLYFQKKMIVSFLLFTILQILILLGVSLRFKINLKFAIFKYFGYYNHSSLDSWNLHTFNMITLTVILSYSILKIRQKSVELVFMRLANKKMNETSKVSHTWYQMRTLQIKGGLKFDFPGTIIKKLITSLMEVEKIKGKLLSLKAVPQLNKAVKAQSRIDDLVENFKPPKERFLRGKLQTWYTSFLS